MTEMYIAARMNRRGDVRYYWYRSVRKGKTVTGEYVRPASDLEVAEYFRERAEGACATSERAKETACATNADSNRSSSELGYKSSVLGLFDRELANNGQSWHIDDIIEQLSETYGSGHEKQIGSAVVALIDSGRLQEISPGNYGRVA